MPDAMGATGTGSNGSNVDAESPERVLMKYASASPATKVAAAVRKKAF
jgi:hypothetical protein